MSDRTTVTVRGVEVPAIGFGTWQITGDDCVEAVRHALELGYRHLDTARAYGNEREVGRGLRESGVPRDDVWVTTKVWYPEARADEVRRSAEASVAELGVDAVDLLLFHWPNPAVPLDETMGALAAVREDGRARQVGVSNFPAGLLRRALDHAPVFCDQVEYHPLLAQDRLIDVCAEHDVLLAAYAPFAHGDLLGHPVLEEIARRHDVSTGQVALRWLIEQEGVCALPKAASAENRRRNLDVHGFSLTDEDRAEIAALPKDHRRFNPSWAPDWAD